jgi:hypothetical protein
MAYDAKKLRAADHAVAGHLRMFDQLAARPTHVVDARQFSQLQKDLEFHIEELPGLLPQFDRKDMLGREGVGWYDVGAIRIYLQAAGARVKAELEASESRAPIAEPREFSFVKDAKLRVILERDYIEVQAAFATRCWKSVIILCGGAIEATLLDLLLQDEAKASAAKAAPKGKPDLLKWDLSDLIKVAVELGVVGPGLDAPSDTLRQYRNLIHPGNELRSGLTPQKEEARIALGLLDLLHRELSK